MREEDEGALLTLVSEVYGFYRKPFSKFTGSIWLNAMRPFDFGAVADALNRHCVNPDTGQYCPWPADVVRMLEGTTQDASLVAWSKVNHAVHVVGPWADVVFDDALIHRVIAEMGGWVSLGDRYTKDWDFVKNEFVNRYRGYRMRSERPEYQPVLTGTANASNAREQKKRAAPVLIGDQKLAVAVMRGGAHTPHIAVTPMSVLLANSVKHLQGETSPRLASVQREAKKP